MRTISSCLVIFIICSCASAKEMNYTASTPAAPVIRSFLGIAMTDSIDFIRWKIQFNNNHYSLQCNYGIAKPNTNGFINGGKKIELNGELKKEKNIYRLHNGNETLGMAELNSNLLHLLNTDNSLLVGNGGWSYTLNNITPSITNQINITVNSTTIKDSIVFEGRTPCKVPGIIPAGTQCYKLKWGLILFTNVNPAKKGKYKLYGTPWYEQGGKTGNWEILEGNDNRITYILKDENGTPFVYLLNADNNILLFTDTKGNLLVGDEDFSYTLNRKS